MFPQAVPGVIPAFRGRSNSQTLWVWLKNNRAGNNKDTIPIWVHYIFPLKQQSRDLPCFSHCAGPGDCFLSCTINSSCHLRIDRICICLTEVAKRTWHFISNLSDDFLKYGIKNQSLKFIRRFLKGNALGIEKGKTLAVKWTDTHTLQDYSIPDS